jgi:hypothetical protein
MQPLLSFAEAEKFPRKTIVYVKEDRVHNLVVEQALVDLGLRDWHLASKGWNDP